jgi:hypothetical protein
MKEESEDLFGIRLGHEELAVLLGIMRAKTLPGLEEDLLEGLSREQQEAALSAAERSLRARGMIQVFLDEARIEVEPLTLALLGTCVYPQYTSSVMVLDKKGDIKQGYYHGRDNLLVEHSFPGPGIYDFVTAAERKIVEARFFDTLQLSEGSAPEGEPFELPVYGMEEARELVKMGKREELAALLSERGMNGGAAERAIGIFEEAAKSLLLTRVEYGESPDDIKSHGLAILEVEGSYWAMMSDTGRMDMIVVAPFSYEEARNRASEIIGREALA